MHIKFPGSALRPLARRSLVAISLVVVCLSARASAQDADPATLVAALKGGGHVIYIRHAATETDYADQVAAVLGDCSTQRMLSEAGWQQARSIGAAIADADIPVGQVMSSDYCRAWQTADLAFGSYEKTPALNFEKAEDYSPEQIARMRDNLVPLLSTVPAVGNLVIVGHDDTFEAATGIYPEPQGVAFVLKPDGQGGFAILGAIAPDAWPTM